MFETVKGQFNSNSLDFTDSNSKFAKMLENGNSYSQTNQKA